MSILADSVCLLMHCKCEETDSELSGPDENKKQGHYRAMFLKATIHYNRLLQTLGIIQIRQNQFSCCLSLLCIINCCCISIVHPDETKQMTLPVISSFCLLPSLKRNQTKNTFLFAIGVCDSKQTLCGYCQASAWSTEEEAMVKCRHFTIMTLAYPQPTAREGRQLPKCQRR